MKRLKKCPFCGGDAEFADYGQPGEFEDWAVYCKSCRIAMLAPGPEEGCIATREEAAKAWNRRAVPKTTQILTDILDGTPLLYPCDKLWSPEGWCKDHCKPGQQEPDAECWMKYVEIAASEWNDIV